LAPFYPLQPPRPMGIVLVFAFVLVVITLLVIRNFRKGYLPLGWFWFILMLLPVIGFFQSGVQAAADRYTYFAIIGLFIVLAGLAAKLRPPIAAALTVLLLGVSAWAASQQVALWRSTRVLFEHADQVTENNQVAAEMLGEQAMKEGDMPKALRLYQRGVELAPGNANAYTNLAQCVFRIDPASSLPFYKKAVELEPQTVNYRFNLAVALITLGKRDEAMAEIRAAAALQPDDPRVQQLLNLSQK